MLSNVPPYRELEKADCDQVSSSLEKKSRRPRIAFVISHPIQHFCPQYASLASCKLWNVQTFFASRMGAEPYEDANFRQRISWDTLYLNEFQHSFLNAESLPSDRHLDAPTIDAELTTYSPDVVVVYGYSHRFQKRVRSWAARNGALVYYISDSYTHRKERLLKRVLKSVWLRQHFKTIHRVLSVGNSNEFYYFRHGISTDRITRMNYPIDIRTYEAAFHSRSENRRRLRDAIGCGDDAIVFTIVGKLVNWKRQEDAIRAIARVSTEADVKLLVIGSGPNETELRSLATKLAGDRVHFTGFVPAADLPQYYAASDVYVHTSSKEPHSVAISEAIYMGLPVILSDRCGSYGPWDDVQAGRNGFVYATGDVTALAHRMAEFADNASRRETFSIASRNYAVEAQRRAHGVFLKEALAADGLL